MSTNSTKARKSGHLGVDQTRGPAAARKRAYHPERHRGLLVHRWGCRSTETCACGCLVGLSKRAHLAYLDAKNSTTRGRTGTSPPPPGPAPGPLQLLMGARGRSAQHQKTSTQNVVLFCTRALQTHRASPPGATTAARRHGLTRVFAGTGLTRWGDRGLRPGSASCAQGGLK